MRLLTTMLGIAALIALTTPSPRYTEGKATYYSQGVFQRVAAYRGVALAGATGWASYPNCDRIGGLIYVSVLNPRTGAYSGFHSKRIVDCSQVRDYARHVRDGLVELSYEDAIKYGYKSSGKTRIRYYLGASR